MAREIVDMEKSDAYTVLAGRHGYKDSVRYRRILEYLMTPEQAEMVTCMPVNIQEMANKLHKDAKFLREEMEHLYAKGAIFARNAESLEEAIFALGVVQLHDITMCPFDLDLIRDRKLFELWDDFFVEEWDPDQVAGWSKASQPQGRIVPAYKAILDSPEILPYEDMREIIKSARSISVTYCTCRRRKEAVGKTCRSSHAMVDIQFNLSAEYLIGRNAARRLSADEALELIDECEELGLIHTCENSTRMRPRWGMCNCCTDCCMIFEPLNRFRVPVTKCVAQSRYEARVNRESCTGCQDCIEWCQFDAIEMVKQDGSNKYRASIDTEKCMGCGVCVLKCEPGALHLQLVRPVEHIPPVE